MSSPRAFLPVPNARWRENHLPPIGGSRQQQTSLPFVGEKGMTLIELMVALAMLGILLPMAAVSLGSLAPKFDLDNAARKTVMVLNQARVQAITRGHTVVVTFGTDTFLITDTTNHETVAEGEFPSYITVSAEDDATFTPLGTVTIPVTVTVSNSEDSRDVSVGLTGEVQVQ